MSPAAPTRRVQRVAEQWPVVHLESEIPDVTSLTVDGLVQHPRTLSLRDVAAIGPSDHVVDLHCVWGWSKPNVVWTGLPLAAVLELAGSDCGGDPHVIVSSASDTYSSCLPLQDGARGILAWARDGSLLSGAHGGPLRYLAPHGYWAYKGVKWATRVTVVDRFVPGFWESRLDDPMGRITEEVELP
jgi:DMSO/TMAO reductase YedYZ molybdopterin-dependent catalytic subunit